MVVPHEWPSDIINVLQSIILNCWIPNLYLYRSRRTLNWIISAWLYIYIYIYYIYTHVFIYIYIYIYIHIYIYIYICVFLYAGYYIYKERVLNICYRAYGDFTSVDTESVVFGNCQLLAYAIIRPNRFPLVINSLCTVSWVQMERVIKFVRYSGNG